MITLELFAWLSALEVKKLKDSVKFSLAPEAFVTVLEGKLKMDCFPELYLPSNDDINQAPHDIVERLHAVTSVDVKALGFELRGDCGPHFAGWSCVSRVSLILGALHPGSRHHRP